MASSRNYQKKQKNNSLVSLVFVLGIIGWGFFAIDRLTSSNKSNTELPEVISQNTRGTENNISGSVKKGVLSWIEDNFLSKKGEIQSKELIQESNTIPVIKQDLSLSKIKLYFYHVDDESEPSLYRVERKTEISLENLPLATFTYLIKGPTKYETDRFLTDSFPNKPKVLSVKRSKNLLQINFDNNFGSGVSSAILKFQITQLLKTALQFSDIKGIQIYRQGQPYYLGVNGENFPKVITSESWRAVY